MPHINTSLYSSPFGELIIGSYKDKLCLCDWRDRSKRRVIDQRLTKHLDAELSEQRTPIHLLARKQLDEYFEGKRKEFDLPLLPVGTDFQKRVWHALIRIPFGTTLSYKELADKLGDKGAVRAIASANGSNALAIIIPCHRVIGSNGSLVGYAGGNRVKQQLLELEQGQKQQSMF